MSTMDLARARWRKSSWSTDGGDSACVEVAFVDVQWRKSSRSGQGGQDNCVEVALVDAAVAVRDSKNPAGPVLVVPMARWTDFLGTLA
jgi:hypothetical protein